MTIDVNERPEGEVLVVSNPTIDKPIEPELLDAAMPAETEWRHVAPKSVGEAERVLADAANTVERLVVIGGDGMVHLAATALCGSSTTLGIIGAGTGNDVLRSLGIETPERTRESMCDAMTIALGPAIDIDVGLANHNPFMSVATLGFSATVNERANRLRWPRGAAAYKVATLLELPRLSPVEATVTVDGNSQRVEAALIAVGNTAFFGGGMEICPGADPSDGLLDVTIIGAVGPITLLRTFPKVYKAEHVQDPRVQTLRGAEIRIDCADETWPVWADGEPLSDTPAVFEVIEGGLAVAAPGV